jgi:hypothetical protein
MVSVVAWLHVLGQSIMVAGVCDEVYSSHNDQEAEKKEFTGHRYSFQSQAPGTYFLQLATPLESFYNLPK